MPLITDTRGRTDENSGYVRLLGSPQLGQLISRIHATSIRAGNELESILCAATPYLTSGDVLQPRSALWERQQVQVVFGASFADLPGHKADFVVLDHGSNRAYLVEVKDGDTFDTKKSTGELANLRVIADYVQHRTGYRTTYHFCAFNQTSRAAIVAGAKRRFTEDQTMTGRELSQLIGADYDAITEQRRVQQAENLDYLLRQLIAIPEVRQWLLRNL